MVEETESQIEEEQQLEAQTGKELRLEMRVEAERYGRIKDIADYAAVIGLIPADHRGNITAWVNYCLTVVEELLRQQEYKSRGF